MRRVYKYPLEIEYAGGVAGWEPAQTIRMPIGAKILSVGVQGINKGVFWALVDPEAELESRTVYVTNTGGPLDDKFDKRRFVGTLIFKGGEIVLHVFE